MIEILGNVHAMTLTMDEHAMNVNPGTEKHQTVFVAVMKNLEKAKDAKVNQKQFLLYCC